MFEDSLTNLQTCKQLGMTTIFIGTTTAIPDYVDYQADTLLKALQGFFSNYALRDQQ